MSEKDLFIELIPQIAEMIVEVQKMPREQYEQFKQEYLEECRKHHPAAVEFVKKVLTVVDTYFEKQEEGEMDAKE